MSAQPKAARVSSLILPLLTALTALGSMSVSIYLPSLPNLATSLHATAASVKLSLTLFLFVFALSQLIYGPLSDRFGRKPPVVAGLLIYLAGKSGLRQCHECIPVDPGAYAAGRVRRGWTCFGPRYFARPLFGRKADSFFGCGCRRRGAVAHARPRRRRISSNCLRLALQFCFPHRGRCRAPLVHQSMAA